MSKKNLQLYVAVHLHEYGSSVFFFKSTPEAIGSEGFQDRLVKTLNIDFEPDKQEFIDIDIANVSDETPEVL